MDVLVDKMASDLKSKLRKAVEKHEKLLTKQLTSSQKVTNGKAPTVRVSSSRVAALPAPSKRKTVAYNSDTDESDSDHSR
jgi:hypothetical protein